MEKHGRPSRKTHLHSIGRSTDSTGVLPSRECGFQGQAASEIWRVGYSEMEL
jgi:hypothetical protein